MLSGFVNGVFLVLVAFFVLYESLQRFVAPPEVNTDRLLLVSVLGLGVNLIGIWSFHGEHGGHCKFSPTAIARLFYVAFV